MLWVGDGTPYELFFQRSTINKKGHRLVKYYERKFVYVVIDAFNDAIMGYAIGEVENVELAKLAWRNACVTRGMLPDQIKTDRFAQKELKAFYQRLALNADFYTPSEAGNARDKVIEPFFARLYDQVTRMHDNASGRNIKAKEQLNPDHVQLVKHSFPVEDGVVGQIQDDMLAWNERPLRKLEGQSLIQQWEAALDESKVRKLTDRSRLELFGVPHSHTNTLTNKGLEVTLDGRKRIYATPDHNLFDTIGTTYQVIYDPCDYSKVLIDNGKKHFLVDEFEPIPMAYGDMQEGDRMRLNTWLRFKKERVELMHARNMRDMELIRAEAATKAYFPETGSTNKHTLQNAENLLKEGGDFEGDVFDDLPDIPLPGVERKDESDDKLDRFDE